MKTHPSRRTLLGVVALIVTVFTSGCAEMVDVLNATANELERQRLEAEYASYYMPRPSSDTSAAGIK